MHDIINWWQHIYSNIDPIAFRLGPVAVHWYGIMYATALLLAIFIAYKLNERYKFISKKDLDDYIWWVEIGIILGARVGYIIFYDTHTLWYLTHPWQIFNPFMDGVFVGISGFSYHGAVIGFIVATILFSIKRKISFWKLVDLATLSIPFAYVFGRLGNFFNQGLVGRVTEVPWGVYVGDILRHPSQLYEAFMEGIVVGIILFWYKKRQKFEGEIAIMYVLLYSTARIICEFFREPDIQIGFLFGTNWLTMGMLISFCYLFFISLIYIYKKNN